MSKKTKKKTKKNSAKEKKQESELKSWGQFFLIIIVVVALFFGFFTLGKWLATKDYVEYNKFLFVPSEGQYWRTEILANNQLYTIQFYHNPLELETIPMDPNAEKYIMQEPSQVFITVSPDDPSQVVVAGVEIAKILGTGYGILNLNTRSALNAPANDDNPENRTIPVVTCAMATLDRAVINIRIGTENRISTEGRCIIIEGKSSEDTIKVADRYLYSLLGIMNP